MGNSLRDREQITAVSSLGFLINETEVEVEDPVLLVRDAIVLSKT